MARDPYGKYAQINVGNMREDAGENYEPSLLPLFYSEILKATDCQLFGFMQEEVPSQVWSFVHYMICSCLIWPLNS